MRDAVKLPLAFDPVRLLQDVDQIPPALWVAHFNPADYDGGWSVLALYSPTGSSSFILPMQTDHVHLIETPILLQCSYLKDVVESFHCPKRSVRLLRLHAAGTIKEHTDPRLSYADGVIRLHIPIRTNLAVAFYVNHTRVVMNPGECWYMDFSLPHRVLNPSPEDRVHLVIDCVVNSWLRQIFEPLGFTD
jgi:hypothetical protein